MNQVGPIYKATRILRPDCAIIIVYNSINMYKYIVHSSHIYKKKKFFS